MGSAAVRFQSIGFGSICLAAILLGSGFSVARGAEPEEAQAKALKSKIADLKQVSSKLATQIETLEKQLQAIGGANPKRPAVDPNKVVTVPYVVSDLVGSQPGADGGSGLEVLARHIRANVAADSWKEAGGKGDIALYKENLSLVVRQSLKVHQELAEYLQKVRESKQVLDALDALDEATQKAEQR